MTAIVASRRTDCRVILQIISGGGRKRDAFGDGGAAVVRRRGGAGRMETALRRSTALLRVEQRQAFEIHAGAVHFRLTPVTFQVGGQAREAQSCVGEG